MSDQMISASIVGAAGYTGSELLRLLVNHPRVKINEITSRSQEGKSVVDVFPELTGETDLKFTRELSSGNDVVFLCLQHGEAKKYVEEHPELLKSKIIDLSRDYRMEASGNKFVYGLPELNRDLIRKSNFVANPGCFATTIELGLLPLAQQQLISSDVHVTAITGSTGAGQKPTDTTHFSWRVSNLSAYQMFDHPHNPEILQTLRQLQQNFSGHLLFIPQRGPFTRGIMATIMVKTNLAEEPVKKIFRDYYDAHPFVKVSEKNIDLKMVVNTNKCFLYLKKHKDCLLILSVIDNLLKGASGQAVQNMNLMFGIEEQEGLKLKASAY